MRMFPVLIKKILKTSPPPLLKLKCVAAVSIKQEHSIRVLFNLVIFTESKMRYTLRDADAAAASRSYPVCVFIIIFQNSFVFEE